MALIDKASLLMVPSTYEDGTLYNVLPTGNKAPDETGSHNGYDQTRADFSFTRGSNLAATRRNSSGLIEKGRENLLLQSNAFDTTWTNSNSSETSGQEGYDGTNNAWKLTKSAANGMIYQSISSSGVQTLSVYAKKDANTWMQIYGVGSPNVRAYYNLSDGTLGAYSLNTIDRNIEDVGNGWYRCSVTFSSSITNVRIFVSDGNNDDTGTSGSIFIQNAQLEKGLIASDVITTTTASAQAGILEDMPRINYDANGENGALLLEPNRTNLFAQSEYLNDGSTWSPLGSSTTVETNSAISPEGVNNASKIEKTDVRVYAQILSSPTLVSGTKYTLSCFIKKGTHDIGFLSFNNYDTDAKAYYDLTNETHGLISGSGVSTDLIDYGDGWYRCVISGFSTTTDLAGRTNIGLSYSTSNSNWPSISDGDGLYMYYYGAQLEAGSYSSSLIPTHGAAVTRGADFAQADDLDDFVNQSEGTLFIDFEIEENTGGTFPVVLDFGDKTASNRFGILRTSDDEVRVYMVAGGTAQVNYDTTQTSGRLKIAFGYKANDAAIYVNGTQVYTDSSFSVSTNKRAALNQYAHVLGSAAYTTQSSIYDFTIFDERLSNSELESLTE